MSLPLPDAVIKHVLSYSDARGLSRFASVSKPLNAFVDDSADAGGAPSLAGLVWKALCDAFEIRQPGSRTRGWLPWSRVYRARACIECASAGTIIVNDPVLGFPNQRFSICAACAKSGVFWRVRARPEIRGDASRLDHLLFRIATVRRELGYKRVDQPRRRRDA